MNLKPDWYVYYDIFLRRKKNSMTDVEKSLVVGMKEDIIFSVLCVT